MVSILGFHPPSTVTDYDNRVRSETQETQPTAPESETETVRGDSTVLILQYKWIRVLILIINLSCANFSLFVLTRKIFIRALWLQVPETTIKISMIHFNESAHDVCSS